MTIDIERFLSDSGIERELLEQWIQNEWIVPSRSEVGVHFTSVDVARVYFVRDLSSDFGVNDAGIEVALHLIDQIHGLRRLLADLRHGVDSLGPTDTPRQLQ